MRSRVVMLSGWMVAALVTVGGVAWATSQPAFPDGSFVQGQDGSIWVVSNGTRYGVVLTSDIDNILPTLQDGPTVATAGELTVVLSPPVATPTNPPPAPSAALGTRERPIPIGQLADLDDGWSLKVNSVTPNADALIAARNRFNDPPKPGRQFFIANVTAAYIGPDSKRFDGDFRLRTVGASAVSYTTFDDGCGVIPDELPDKEVFSGGIITGNICWSIASADANSLVMYDSPFLGDRNRRLYFSLTR